MRKLLIILGVPVDDLTMPEALQRIAEFVTIGRLSGKTHQIATVNADFVVNSLHDAELRRILQESDMATADGTPLVLGARMLGVPIRDRVTGADLVPELAKLAAEKGFSIFFLGAKQGVGARAADMLKQRHPSLKIAGVLSPPNRPMLEMDPSVIETVKAARPDILLVAFGNPKQEKWISRHAKTLRVPVAIGVGGTFDMIAGVTQRAPRWMQRTGLEWSYRLIQEPRRLWKRYVLDFAYFGYFFAHQLWAMRTSGIGPAPLPTSDVTVVDDVAVITVRGRLDASNQASFASRVEQALIDTPYLAINLAEATFLDSAALGTLVSLTNRARAAGGKLQLVATPPNIRNILTLVRLDAFFDMVDSLDRIVQPIVERQAQRQSRSSEWSVLRMPRIIDAGITPLLIDQMHETIAQNPRVILDFSDTVLLSSAGLSAVARLNRESRERGGELRAAGCSNEVLYSIRLVKLDAMVPLFSDVMTASS